MSAVRVIANQKAVHIDMEAGCGGFVFFEAKLGLIEYYKEKLGAKQKLSEIEIIQF